MVKTDSNVPEVTVCATESAFPHSTLSPNLIETSEGTKCTGDAGSEDPAGICTFHVSAYTVAEIIVNVKTKRIEINKICIYALL
ncbi:MAG: hypothetical protein OEL82_04930 [Nitrosopumilus sp.]|nr:hypothetical protein [Nitrosopumilus sp.]